MLTGVGHENDCAKARPKVKTAQIDNNAISLVFMLLADANVVELGCRSRSEVENCRARTHRSDTKRQRRDARIRISRNADRSRMESPTRAVSKRAGRNRRAAC